MGQTFYQDRWYRIYESGSPPTAVIQMADAVMAVPLTADNHVLFTNEYSPAFDARVLILPSGGIEAGEDPAQAINRELQEEAGYKAGRLDLLGILCPFIKYLNQHITVYLARDLQPSRLPADESFEIGVEAVPLGNVEALIAAGRVQDSIVIASLCLARTFLANAKNEKA
ncbi:MAG: NUDIX domain-containing protein [Chloroflexi bacterium]|nr:NUDIX domain-containing protein [Chloroflexota bacterium]